MGNNYDTTKFSVKILQFSSKMFIIFLIDLCFVEETVVKYLSIIRW